jgi:hypothetical protein
MSARDALFAAYLALPPDENGAAFAVRSPALLSGDFLNEQYRKADGLGTREAQRASGRGFATSTPP